MRPRIYLIACRLDSACEGCSPADYKLCVSLSSFFLLVEGRHPFPDSAGTGATGVGGRFNTGGEWLSPKPRRASARVGKNGRRRARDPNPSEARTGREQVGGVAHAAELIADAVFQRSKFSISGRKRVQQRGTRGGRRGGRLPKPNGKRAKFEPPSAGPRVGAGAP